VSGPNPVLMHYYGNEEMYQKKLAAEAERVPEGMVRLASIVAQAGVDLAKKAGIVGTVAGGLIKSPLARKAVTVGAIGGAGLLAAKGIRKTQQVMGSESGPQTFGPGRFGFNPAFGVNEYGQAAPGTPLV
jgi:hypothetical protein